MRSVIISAAAEAEIDLIYEYLAVYSTKAADAFLDAVEDRIAMLEQGFIEFPLARDTTLSDAGYHATLVKSYVMLYTVTEESEVRIAHAFHQSQDYASLVSEIQ